jgi:hypothetical protein
VLVYPNPADRFLHVVFPEDLQLESLELVNLVGQIVYSRQVSDNRKISIKRNPAWHDGVYYLRARGHNRFITKKVIFF